jgi:hypothetical protein
MKHRPISDKGFPVPYFVRKIDGQWDFRVVDPDRLVKCHRYNQCWLCGERLGQYLAFVVGPMCSVNRISSEPPSHLECAEYAVRACPFLTKPRMRRNDKDLPHDGWTPGLAIEHNPGATLIWVTKSYHAVKDGLGGVLFQFDDPISVQWYAEGRAARRDEILAAFDKGLPYLRKTTVGFPEAAAALDQKLAEAMKLVPPALPEPQGT